MGFQTFKKKGGGGCKDSSTLTDNGTQHKSQVAWLVLCDNVDPLISSLVVWMFGDKISVGLSQYDRTLKVHLWSPMWWIQDGQQILFKTWRCIHTGRKRMWKGHHFEHLFNFQTNRKQIRVKMFGIPIFKQIAVGFAFAFAWGEYMYRRRFHCTFTHTASNFSYT